MKQGTWGGPWEQQGVDDTKSTVALFGGGRERELILPKDRGGAILVCDGTRGECT